MISHEFLDDELLRLAGKKCASGIGHLYEVAVFRRKMMVYKRPLGSIPFPIE